MKKLIEVMQNSTLSKSYSLREVFVNPRHVVMLREDHVTKKTINEKKMIEGLDDRQQYTRVTIHNGTVGSQFVVVGSPAVVETKLKTGKQLLNG